MLPAPRPPCSARVRPAPAGSPGQLAGYADPHADPNNRCWPPLDECASATRRSAAVCAQGRVAAPEKTGCTVSSSRATRPPICRPCPPSTRSMLAHGCIGDSAQQLRRTWEARAPSSARRLTQNFVKASACSRGPSPTPAAGAGQVRRRRAASSALPEEAGAAAARRAGARAGAVRASSAMALRCNYTCGNPSSGGNHLSAVSADTEQAPGTRPLNSARVQSGAPASLTARWTSSADMRPRRPGRGREAGAHWACRAARWARCRAAAAAGKKRCAARTCRSTSGGTSGRPARSARHFGRAAQVTQPAPQTSHYCLVCMCGARALLSRMAGRLALRAITGLWQWADSPQEARRTDSAPRGLPVSAWGCCPQSAGSAR